MDFLDNFKFEEDTKNKTIPPGIYEAKITGFTVTNEDDRPKINYEYSLIQGEYSPLRIWINQVLTPKSKYFINKNLAPLGLKVSEPKDLRDVATAIVGKEVKILVGHSTYKSPKNPDKVFYTVDITEEMKANAIPF